MQSRQLRKSWHAILVLCILSLIVAWLPVPVYAVNCGTWSASATTYQSSGEDYRFSIAVTNKDHVGDQPDCSGWIHLKNTTERKVLYLFGTGGYTLAFTPFYDHRVNVKWQGVSIYGTTAYLTPFADLDLRAVPTDLSQLDQAAFVGQATPATAAADLGMWVARQVFNGKLDEALTCPLSASDTISLGTQVATDFLPVIDTLTTNTKDAYLAADSQFPAALDGMLQHVVDAQVSRAGDCVKTTAEDILKSRAKYAAGRAVLLTEFDVWASLYTVDYVYYRGEPIQATIQYGAPSKTTPDQTTTTPTTPERGHLAFVGPNGNVEVADSDGHGAVPITSDGTEARPYREPRWSPDGKLLAFVGPARDGPIYILRNGHIDIIRGIHGCDSPVFLSDNAHLVYGCSRGLWSGNGKPPDGDPAWAGITESALDGSSWQIVLPRVASPFEATPIDVSPDGTLLVYLPAEDGIAKIMTLAPDGTHHDVRTPGLDGMPISFDPSGRGIIAEVCDGGCSIGAS